MEVAPPELSAELSPAVVCVEPASGASTELRVDNAGAAAAVLSLEIIGAPAEWAWASPLQLSVAPHSQAVARVVFRPPRSSAAIVGPTPFTVRLAPAGGVATDTFEVAGVVEVVGVAEVEARLVPPAVSARRSSRHVLILENRGTVPATVEVTADGNDLDVVVEPTHAEVAPGPGTKVTVSARARRPLVGWHVQRRSFRLAVATQGSASATPSPVLVEGALLQQPVRWLVPVVVVALLAAITGVVSAGSGSESDPTEGETADVATEAPELPAPRYAVGTRTETFVDASRPTRAYADKAAQPTRTLETVVFYPATGSPGGEVTPEAPPATAEGPFPLIVFAHGSGGLGERYFGLLRTWAGAGYLVAAPRFPFATDPDTASPDDYPNQPGDMSFVVDRLLAADTDSSDELSGLIDPEHIGAAGHSLGGMTTLGLVANTCCHDPRFDAGVVLAGRQVPFPGGDFWVRIGTPVLLIHGDADTSVVYADGRTAYQEAPPPKHLVTMLGGDHSDPYQGPATLPAVRVVTAATLDFFDHHLRDAADGLDRLQADANVRGVSRIETER